MRKVIVVYLDMREEVFEYADYRISDGVLAIWKENDRRTVRHIPLTSIRSWVVER
jgi:hypothetical protein